MTASTNPGPTSKYSRPESGHRKRKHEREAPRSRFGEPYWKDKRRRIPGGDGTRRWVYSPRDTSSHKRRFTIASYNILRVENASKHPDLYDKVTPDNLNWDWRRDEYAKS